jgi:predicted RNA-binding Zn-ribbon protein involved in translation (DUF1610 family)
MISAYCIVKFIRGLIRLTLANTVPMIKLIWNIISLLWLPIKWAFERWEKRKSDKAWSHGVCPKCTYRWEVLQVPERFIQPVAGMRFHYCPTCGDAIFENSKGQFSKSTFRVEMVRNEWVLVPGE